MENGIWNGATGERIPIFCQRLQKEELSFLEPVFQNHYYCLN